MWLSSESFDSERASRIRKSRLGSASNDWRDNADRSLRPPCWDVWVVFTVVLQKLIGPDPGKRGSVCQVKSPSFSDCQIRLRPHPKALSDMHWRAFQQRESSPSSQWPSSDKRRGRSGSSAIRGVRSQDLDLVRRSIHKISSCLRPHNIAQMGSVTVRPLPLCDPRVTGRDVGDCMVVCLTSVEDGMEV